MGKYDNEKDIKYNYRYRSRSRSLSDKRQDKYRKQDTNSNRNQSYRDREEYRSREKVMTNIKNDIYFNSKNYESLSSRKREEKEPASSFNYKREAERGDKENYNKNIKEKNYMRRDGRDGKDSIDKNNKYENRYDKRSTSKDKDKRFYNIESKTQERIVDIKRTNRDDANKESKSYSFVQNSFISKNNISKTSENKEISAEEEKKKKQKERLAKAKALLLLNKIENKENTEIKENIENANNDKHNDVAVNDNKSYTCNTNIKNNKEDANTDLRMEIDSEEKNTNSNNNNIISNSKGTNNNSKTDDDLIGKKNISFDLFVYYSEDKNINLINIADSSEEFISKRKYQVSDILKLEQQGLNYVANNNKMEVEEEDTLDNFFNDLIKNNKHNEYNRIDSDKPNTEIMDNKVSTSNGRINKDSYTDNNNIDCKTNDNEKEDDEEEDMYYQEFLKQLKVKDTKNCNTGNSQNNNNSSINNNAEFNNNTNISNNNINANIDNVKNINIALSNKDNIKNESSTQLAIYSTNINNQERFYAEEYDDDIVIENEDYFKQDEWLKKKSKLEKGKELIPVHHSEIEYLPLIKNVYHESREIKLMSKEEVESFRKDNGDIHIRGKHPINPIKSWYQCGLHNNIINFLINVKNYSTPFPIQCQAIPCLMSGRDIIGIAETGSGKTLAYLLPMIRHIMIQKPLRENDGPIGLVIVPTRELAWQIYQEASIFCHLVNLKVSCVFGGMAMENQISGISRGSHIIVCTPGRMIDILSLNKGNLLSLQRTSFVVLDEADRMFDLGFGQQINKILMNIRPDRQISLFSATFHQQVENEARKLISREGRSHILEIIVGTRGKACGNVEQFVEVVDDKLRFVKLLEILEQLHSDSNKNYCKYRITNFLDKENTDTNDSKAINNEDNKNNEEVLTNKKNFGLKKIESFIKSQSAIDKQIINDNGIKEKSRDNIHNQRTNLKEDKDPKILIFVEEIDEADELFKQLLKSGFPSLVVHSGQEQDDRFSFIEDFKSGFRNILIATSLMSRGLDVPELEYVINFRCPNHYEDYIHRVGRTGRAGNKGVSITFISKEEDHLAEVVEKALEVSHKEVPKEIKQMVSNYTLKVERGEAQKFKFKITQGRGFKHDSKELNLVEDQRNKIKKIYELTMGGEADNYDEDKDKEIKDNNNNNKGLVALNNKNNLYGIRKKIENSLIMKSEANNQLSIKLNDIRNPRIKQKFIEAGSEAAKNALLRGESIEVAHQKALESIEKACENYQPHEDAEKKQETAQSILSKWEKIDNIDKNVFTKDLEINDYPEQVRMRISRKDFKRIVGQFTTCDVSSKGVYVKPRNKIPPGVRKLYLQIKGNSEIEVQNAYNELLRMINSWAIDTVNNSKIYKGKY